MTVARPKEYVRDEVLDKAMQLFWQKGFKAASVAELVQATGLNSASLYKEFGDKDGLFEAALDHYRATKVGPRLQMLRDQPNLSGVEAVLDSVANGAVAGDYKGCLMMNHLAQTHTISPKAAELIETFCADLEALMAAALRNAQVAGEIPADEAPEDLASFLVCWIHGVVLYGRHAHGKRQIPNLYEVVLEALRR